MSREVHVRFCEELGGSSPGLLTDYLRKLIERDNTQLSINRQCDLLGLSHSSYYLAHGSPVDMTISTFIKSGHFNLGQTGHYYFGSTNVSVMLESKMYLRQYNATKFFHK